MEVAFPRASVAVMVTVDGEEPFGVVSDPEMAPVDGLMLSPVGRPVAPYVKGPWPPVAVITCVGVPVFEFTSVSVVLASDGAGLISTVSEFVAELPLSPTATQTSLPVDPTPPTTSDVPFVVPPKFV